MAEYREEEVVAFQQDVINAYASVGRQTDLNNVVWSARMVFDATAGGMGYPAARQKHLQVLKQELGSVTPVPPLPVPPNGGGDQLRGRLRSENNGSGPRLIDDIGPFKWKFVTAFDALRLVTTKKQSDIDKLRAYCAWVRSVNGNGLRVFLNWNVSKLDFRLVPDFFACLQTLGEITHDEHLRLLGTAICDQIPDGLTAQQDFLDKAFQVLNRFEHTIGECANEPYNNNSVLPSLFKRSSLWGNLTVARGMCSPDANPASGNPNDKPYLPSLGWTTYQTGRSDDWYRKVGKDGMEIRNGVLTTADGSHDGTINNEMMGAAETYQTGRRSNRPDEFFMAGVAAAMFNSGATGHGDSTTMQLCNIPGPTETECIRQLFRGVDIVPVGSPTWEYARYGVNHPPAPMPVEPDPIDGDDSRIHSMINGSVAVSINYRFLLDGHGSWKPQGINDWRTEFQDGPFVQSKRG